MKKRYRLTRYTINAKGKLQAKKDGGLCKGGDAFKLEELFESKTKETAMLRKQKNKFESDAKLLRIALENTSVELHALKELLNEVAAMLDATEANDGALVREINARAKRPAYINRVWLALRGVR